MEVWKIALRVSPFKDLGGIKAKARFKNVPLHQYFEFRATLWHGLAQLLSNKIEEEHFQSRVYPAKILS